VGGKIVPRGRRRDPGAAIYNGFSGSINLNSTVDWRYPGNTLVSLDGSAYMMDLLAGQAYSLGVSSVSAEQFMDITILHELSHYNGALGDPDRNPAVERALWTDCIK
jgi:hypothetical protein